VRDIEYDFDTRTDIEKGMEYNMKKSLKKLYAIILIIIMLMNYFAVIATAVENFDEEYPYAILKLDSEKGTFKSGQDIYIDVKISKVHMFEISDVAQFKGRVIYDDKVLQFQEFEMVNCLNSGSSEANKIFQVTSFDDVAKKFKLDDTILRIKFKVLEVAPDTETTISLIESEVTTSDDVSVLQVDDVVNIPEITLKLNQEEKHHLKIIKTNENGETITNNSALFKITKLDGTIVYQETDENGIITMPDLEKPNTDTPYIYTIEEILAPTGYIKGEEPIQLTVTFGDTGNVQTATPNANGIANIINEDNTIELKVQNTTKEAELEKEVFNLVLNKVDEANNSITTDTAEFELTMPDGTKASYTTNATGKTENIAVLAPETAGTYTYIIKETKSPEGYIIEENNIILELTYEKQENKIVLVSGKVVSYNNEPITIDNSDVRTATVNIKNEKQIITYNYTISVDKTDEEDRNITSSNAVFEISKDGKTEYLVTNEEGKATYNFSMTNKEIMAGQEYTYEIKEIKAPDGYILDETVKTIKLTFNNDGSINTAIGNGIRHTENEVNIKITNEREPQVVVPEPQNFDFIINKVDENNNLITTDTANFKLTTTNGEIITISTVNGISNKVTLNAPNVAGKQIYFLQETKAPNGYDTLNGSVVIEADFIESEGKIVLDRATIKEYNKEIVPVNNTLTVSIVNIKHQEEEQEKYTIKISGVDRDGNPIENGTTVVKLTNKDTGEYEYKEVQIKDGIIELEMPKVEGTSNYELEQIKAPDGYKVNPNPAQITVMFGKDEDNKVKIDDYEVTGIDTRKDENTEENVISIIMVNDKIEEEPKKQNYSIEINKLDSSTNELITESSAIFTVVDSKGNTKEYGTTSGRLVISEIVPGNVGEINTFVIKEKVAPEGYKLTSETIILKVEFEEVEGKIVVKESELIMGSNIATVSKTETGNIKLDIKNEKDDVEKEKLYVISKKYKKDTYQFYDEYLGKINEDYPIYKEDEDVYQVLEYFYGVLGDTGNKKGKPLTPIAYTIDKPFIDTKIAKYENKNVFVEEFIGNLESNGHMVVLDQNGNELGPKDIVETGMTLRSTLDDQKLEFGIVVKGDGYKAPNEKKAGRVNTGDKNALVNVIAGNTEYVTDPLHLRALDIDLDGRLNTSDKAEITELLGYMPGGSTLPYHVKWSNSNVLADKANIQYIQK